MKEVVGNKFEGMEIEIVDKKKENKLDDKEGSSSIVRWDKFLPKSGLRVLLVEADESTRHIIAALLRKCSYKVATAPDGLKAWEVLKARPHNIDLILTEMEIPSISGYALLTLIMEHEICKNIPVIMMSKYDTVSMVYKCMTRGAADFLVKPIRINELKNLWQHVWRRQSVSRGEHGPEDDSVEPEKLEATGENNATSDRSSGSRACALIREEGLKKGSDAQSSCGKLDIEAESAYSAENEDCSQPKQGLSPVTQLRVHDRLVCGHSDQNLPTQENANADTATYRGNSALDRQERLERQSHAENVNLSAQTSGNQKVITKSPKEAIDLIGAFNNHSKCCPHPNDGSSRNDSSPLLDLSLTRSSPVPLEDKIVKENQWLYRSNTSAFTRYVNRTVHATSDTTYKDNNVLSGDRFSENSGPESNIGSATKDSLFQYRHKILAKNSESECENVSQKKIPISLPMGLIQVDGSSIPPAHCTSSTSPCPNPVNQQLNSFRQFSADIISRSNYPLVDHSPRISSSEPNCRQEEKVESLEDQTRFSVSNQCTSSSLYEETARHLNNPESSHDLKRSLQREAALNKFRLKRKERCFEKKVRYESRKKLAEQRPRIKGQFVRQVPQDPPPPKSDHSGGNLVSSPSN